MTNKIIETRKNANKLLPEILKILINCINNDISFIKCRVKSVDSIYKKMKKLNIDFEEVYDFIGYCVVVNDTNSCYKTLEEIINSNKIVIKEVVDYIKVPADSNKYQAIHIRCQYKNLPLEIQIRSIEMNNKAERDYISYKAGKFEI